ncbi:hypothetical protein PFISCL1PPCAC_21620, partial [Pristionchus fissidentatus]
PLPLLPSPLLLPLPSSIPNRLFSMNPAARHRRRGPVRPVQPQQEPDLQQLQQMFPDMSVQELHQLQQLLLQRLQHLQQPGPLEEIFTTLFYGVAFGLSVLAMNLGWIRFCIAVVAGQTIILPGQTYIDKLRDGERQKMRKAQLHGLLWFAALIGGVVMETMMESSDGESQVLCCCWLDIYRSFAFLFFLPILYTLIEPHMLNGQILFPDGPIVRAYKDIANALLTPIMDGPAVRRTVIGLVTYAVLIGVSMFVSAGAVRVGVMSSYCPFPRSHRLYRIPHSRLPGCGLFRAARSEKSRRHAATAGARRDYGSRTAARNGRLQS